MNLSPTTSRCEGEYQDHWMSGTRPCARRDECARYVQTAFDAIKGGVYPTMPHCVDDGVLTAFIPLTVFKEDDE